MLPPFERTHPDDEVRQTGLAMEPVRELLLPEILLVLRRRRFVIAGCTLLGLLLAVFYVLLRDPRYEAQAQIEVTPAGTNQLGLDEIGANALSPNESTLRLQAAVKILQSNSLALDVMDQLALSQNKTFAGRWHQSRASRPAGWSAEMRDQLLQRFQKNLSVELVPKTDVIVITFRAKDPQLAAAVVNVVVEQFRDRSLRTSYESASQVSDWLSKQLEGLKTKARVSQEQLSTLERTSGLLGQDETDNIVFGKLKQLNEQLTDLESERIVKEARYRIAASGDPELLATSAPDATLQVLRTQQAALRAQYAQLSSKFGSGYPKLAEIASQMTSADAAVDQELKQLKQRYHNDYEAAQHSEQMLRASFEAQKQKAYRLNEDAAQHAILKREVESTQQLYETLQLKLKQAGIAAGLSSANIEVIDPAQVPSQPSDPKPLSSTLIGLGAGLLCGAAVALGLESVDDSVRTPEEAELAAGLPVLGAIPDLHRDPRRLSALLPGQPHRFPEKWDRALMLREPASMAAESYRSACHSLLLASRPFSPQVIAVVSAMPLEGKTTTAANCAIALAQRGAKVMLVDADLRQPTLHEFFGLEQPTGLRNALAMEGNPDLACEIEQQPGLWVLPAGNRDSGSSRVLDAKSVMPLIQRWREAYDYVVIDTPPVTLVSDALVLAACADSVMLVVRCGMTSRRAIRRVCDALRRSQANQSGLLLNAVDLAQHYGYPALGRRSAEAYYGGRNQ
jgi:polysaccharide biosynthesis transport protein